MDFGKLVFWRKVASVLEGLNMGYLAYHGRTTSKPQIRRNYFLVGIHRAREETVCTADGVHIGLDHACVTSAIIHCYSFIQCRHLILARNACAACA